MGTGTVNSEHEGIAQVGAALADARHAKGLSGAYYRKADDALELLGVELAESRATIAKLTEELAALRVRTRTAEFDRDALVPVVARVRERLAEDDICPACDHIQVALRGHQDNCPLFALDDVPEGIAVKARALSMQACVVLAEGVEAWPIAEVGDVRAALAALHHLETNLKGCGVIQAARRCYYNPKTQVLYFASPSLCPTILWHTAEDTHLKLLRRGWTLEYINQSVATVLGKDDDGTPNG